MLYLFMALLAAVIVAADQYTKYLTVTHISSTICSRVNLEECLAHIHRMTEAYGLSEEQLADLPASLPGIPGLFDLRHVHNTGAAWSSFEGMIWLFALIFGIFAAFILWEFPKKRMGFTTFERFCMISVFGGGLGNMIDRLRLGFVVDMINLEFMNFPVFNVADCFITCGCVLLLAHLFFFNREFWKDDKKK